MGKMLITGLPDPDPGQLWCAVCVGEYKEAFRLAAGLDAAWFEKHVNRTPPDDLKVVTPANAKGARLPVLQSGITLTFVPAMGTVALVCWTHATAVSQVVDELPPGFRKHGLIPGAS